MPRFGFMLLFFLLSSGLAPGAMALSTASDLVFPPSFEFGIATAPGQTEDGLDDIWSDFARKGKIRAYQNQVSPELRTGFHSHPDGDLDWVKKSGVTKLRMGLDWQRLMPKRGVFDEVAIAKYRILIRKIKARRIGILLTLFHHSVPKWFQDQGGWKNPTSISDFVQFSEKLLTLFGNDVEEWITFNEPQIFAILAYQAGLWPPGETRGFLSLLDFGPAKGTVARALANMIRAHQEVYRLAHRMKPEIRIGIAQHIGFHQGVGVIGRLIAPFSGRFMNWYFPDRISEEMDFMGINYYGAEWVGSRGIEILPGEEYSEAGRAVHPGGLSLLLKEAGRRYHLPVIITENGIADETDWIRPAYIAEHLAAIHDAMDSGTPVRGYFVWTLADNLEWSDGYCPKFGLLEVDRKKGLKRIPRKSFAFYSKIAKSHSLMGSWREDAWKLYSSHQGEMRPFCRSHDGVTALDVPSLRKIPFNDWRFRRSFR
jgi:beta-glucosidase/6-phospho-beta-glucosidase/beta-galactosidase